MSIELELNELKEAVAKLQHDLKKEQAVTQIANVMARYAYYHTGNDHNACEELFACGDPDLSIEIGPMGLYKGPDAAYKVYGKVHNAGAKVGEEHPGALFVHTLATPIIEVADDLQTAKCIWMSPGLESAIEPSGKPFCAWCWGQYSGDFKYVNGEWKIWHMHFMAWFNTEFRTPWTETTPVDRMPNDRPPMPEDMAPNFPTTYCNEYAPDKTLPFWPIPPKPYKTYVEGEQRMVGAPDGWDQSHT